MRRFYIQRDEDISETSGTGKVAEGIEWSNGKITLTWLSEYESYEFHQSATALEKIRTHKGKQASTKIVWIDPKFEEVEEKAKETKTKEIEELTHEVEVLTNGHSEEGSDGS